MAYHGSREGLSDLETEEKIFLLGFMPLNEVQGVLLGELGESVDLDRIKKLWLPKTGKAAQLMSTDMQLIDDERMLQIVQDIDPKYTDKMKEIDDKLMKNPFWRANEHSIKLVQIDDLIVLQNNINVVRATNLAKRIIDTSDMEQLLDYCFDFSRKNDVVDHHQISNGFLFSTRNHDVRTGKIEVRQIPEYSDDGMNSRTVPALVIPIVAGDPFIYCVRTYMNATLPDGSTKRVYFLTLQNGIHRAYALRSLGVEHMPCIIIDPTSANETNLLLGNWSPERLQQNASQRPPLLKDFFNPDLIEKFNVRRTIMCIKVGLTLEKFTT